MFSLLALLDDIAATFDDVAVMTKLAVKKTSAIMSDDLAVNAGVINGTPADRELPIVRRIFVGSLLNKVYCIVGLLLIMSIYAPLITWLLFLGGLYLCFEGAHKVVEKIFYKNKKAHNTHEVVSEEERVKGAIQTDLVLSAEIIIISKEAISGTFLNQSLVLCLVGLAASVLIYGLVALLIKIDDFGLMLVKRGHQRIGMSLVEVMPSIMRGLGIVGTTAMFLVGGGIISHTFHLTYYLPQLLQNMLTGLSAGLILSALILPAMKYMEKKSDATP